LVLAKDGNPVLEEVGEIKDLGVYYDSLLLFDKHVREKVL